MFEEKLKKQYANSGRRDLTYDVKDLWNYIDQLPDLGALMCVIDSAWSCLSRFVLTTTVSQL